jgi:predicted acylesterase/phospholipase RssA
VPTFDLLRRVVSFDQLRACPWPLRIVATEWRSGDVKVFANAELTDELGPLVLLASAAVPGIFPPVYIGQDIYVDGGVVMNTPLSPAIDVGSDVLHTVYMDPDVAAIPVLGLRNTLDTITRMTMIRFAATMNRDIEVAAKINKGIEKALQGAARASKDAEQGRHLMRGSPSAEQPGHAYRLLTIHRYHPSDDLSGPMGILDFRRERICELITRGYADAVRHDCKASGCLLPAIGEAEQVTPEAGRGGPQPPSARAMSS